MLNVAVAVAGLVGLTTLLELSSAPPRVRERAVDSPLVADASVCEVPAKRPPMDFVLRDASGKDVSLGQFAGKVTLVDFWATWCEPCKAEIPGIVELYDRYRAEGFEVVGLLLLDSMDRVPAFAERFGMKYTLLDASQRPDVEEAIGPIAALPTSLLLTRDGTVCKTHLGYASKEQFEAEVRALLHL